MNGSTDASGIRRSINSSDLVQQVGLKKIVKMKGE